MIPHKVSISIWLEPEDLLDLDRFCQEKNTNRGIVIRSLLRGCGGLGFTQWVKARQKEEN
jgi:hypothetical protein